MFWVWLFLVMTAAIAALIFIKAAEVAFFAVMFVVACVIAAKFLHFLWKRRDANRS